MENMKISLLPGVQTLLLSAIIDHNEEIYGFLLGSKNSKEVKEIKDQMTESRTITSIVVSSISFISFKSLHPNYDQIVKIINEDANILGIFSTYQLSSLSFSLKDLNLFYSIADSIKNKEFIYGLVSYSRENNQSVISFNTRLYTKLYNIFESIGYDIVNIHSTDNDKKKINIDSSSFSVESSNYNNDLINKSVKLSSELVVKLKGIITNSSNQLKEHENTEIRKLQARLQLEKNKNIMLLNELFSKELN